ncbi:YciI family protein [Spirosoma soli]|uniref:YciI family protein n=1 Tax=Spirosoma soli TaxID=1770529 RepID=A0ABW5M0C6_9BACT
MKEFMLLLRNIGGNGQYITTPQDMQDDMPKWQQWMGDIARQGKLVSSKPIDYAGVVVSNQGVTEGPYKAINELVAGYLICKADSLEEAIAFSKSCPILKYSQGSVEVRRILPFEV